MSRNGDTNSQTAAGPQGMGPSSPFGELCYVVLGQNAQGLMEERCQPVPFVGAPTGGPFNFPSPFRTIYNEAIYLAPTAGAGVANCLRPGPDGSPVNYLAPKGSFSLHIPGGTAGATYHLLCGLAGTESIAFQIGDILTLYPAQPAYAGSFPIYGPSAAQAAPGQLLGSKYTTSWATVTPGPNNTAQQTVYYSQPQQAPLFVPGATGASGPTGAQILDLFQAPAAVFGPAAGPSGLSFPLFPYAGIGPTSATQGVPTFRIDELQTFEEQILSPTRRRQITSAGASAFPGPTGATGHGGLWAAPSAVTTTPQGFLTTVQGLHWQNVVLALSSPAATGNPPPMAFSALAAPLQAALQTNQLFLVASNPSGLGSFANELSIEGWPFIFNVGAKTATGDFSNVLIFKFRPGRLVDLVASSNAWTQAEDFNAPSDIAPLSAWLQAYFSQAQSWVSEYPDFSKFVGIITNPAWTGVLALRTDISLDQFPSQLKCLLAGIDLSLFNAHHVGIEVNYVHVRNGTLELPQSSLFGLINYVDPAYAHAHNLPTASSAAPPPAAASQSASGPYDFKVQILQVLFANSKIADFFSKIKLTAATWFDQAATVETDASGAALPSYAIELDGHYENHHGHPSYTFVTAKNQHYTFKLASPILNYVEALKAQFVTIHSATAPGPSGTSIDSIESAFNFWGYMNFKPLPGFDIFSFGSPTGAVQPGEGLYFSNLAIDLDFQVISGSGPTAAPPRVANRTFRFQPAQMTFDPSLSKLRPGSLLSGFPMAIQGLIPALAGATGGPPPKPADLGYRAITLPNALQAGPLGTQWYALQFHLQMGSMGALAAKAGFVGDMLAAWSPTDQAQVMLAIKLPGGDNSGFSLENVLKLTIQDIAFTQPGANGGGATGAGPTGPAPYMLQFKHLGLKLVGVTFPPTGNTDLYLFGPTATSAALHPGSLGWYGAYVGPTAAG
jgi:hypothetical protein